MIFQTDFGLIWTTPWPDEKKTIFLKFADLEIRNFLYENLTFFLVKLYQKTPFVLNADYNGDIPYRLWFDLNNSLTRWKKNQFFRIRQSRNSQTSVG